MEKQTFLTFSFEYKYKFKIEIEMFPNDVPFNYEEIFNRIVNWYKYNCLSIDDMFLETMVNQLFIKLKTVFSERDYIIEIVNPEGIGIKHFYPKYFAMKRD